MFQDRRGRYPQSNYSNYTLHTLVTGFEKHTDLATDEGPYGSGLVTSY